MNLGTLLAQNILHSVFHGVNNLQKEQTAHNSVNLVQRYMIWSVLVHFSVYASRPDTSTAEDLQLNLLTSKTDHVLTIIICESSP